MGKRIQYLVLLWFLGCGPSGHLQTGEGLLAVQGGKIWYEVYGSGPDTPILLLHGGPGGNSLGFEPLKDLQHNGPLIFMDQLGSGRSDPLTDTALMTIENYVDQVERLRKHLDLDNFILYGHSWGTMLGIDYWQAYPERVEAIIFSSPLFSTALWIGDARELIATLPDSLQQAITVHEANKNYTHPEYLQAVEVYYKQYVTRKDRPKVDQSRLRLISGAHIYNYMWGPSEFSSTGTLKNFDRMDLLPQLNIPVLLLAGEFDEARPSTVSYYHSLIPGSKFIEIPEAAHSTLNDNKEATMGALQEFLEELKRNTAKQ